MMPAGYTKVPFLGKEREVSILVLLDDACRPVEAPMKNGVGVKVSILVLLDDACRLFHQSIRLFLFPEFQSLFFWMMPAGLKAI